MNISPPYVRIYQCPLCSRQFKRLDRLQRHQLNHGHPRFHCTHSGCGKRFYRKDVLQRHQAIHPSGDPRINACKRRPQLVSDVSARQPATSYNNNTSSSSLLATEAPTDLPLELSDMDPLFPLTSSPFLSGPTTPQDANAILRRALIEDNDDTNFELPAYSDELNLELELDQSLDQFMQYFRDYNMRRLPFIHCSRLQQKEGLSRPLYLAVAAAGACHTENTSDLSFQLHQMSVQYAAGDLKMEDDSITMKLQIKALNIDYAALSGNSQMEKWAISELYDIWTFLDNNFITLLHRKKDCSDWDHWRQSEELKRTIFVLFIESIAIASIQDITPIIPASALTIDMPCVDSLWDAPTSMDWSFEFLNALTPSPISFQDSFHSFFTFKAANAFDYEFIPDFGQYILICAILETLQTSRRLPLRCMLTSSQQPISLSSVIQENVQHATSLWRELWWSSLECLWARTPQPVCLMEGIVIMDFIDVCLSQPRTIREATNSGHSMKGVCAAVEIFCGLSKAGFKASATPGQHIFGKFAYHAAIAMAKTMVKWLSRDSLPTNGSSTKEDQEQLGRVQQAVRRGLRESALPNAFSVCENGEDLISIVTLLWSVTLSNSQWMTTSRWGTRSRTS